jgi:UDP-N-acetyl-2-amino-2-deoxyglucuronate dehydrogenase
MQDIQNTKCHAEKLILRNKYWFRPSEFLWRDGLGKNLVSSFKNTCDLEVIIVEKPINIGLIGGGLGGEFHAEALYKLKEEGLAELTAIADPIEAKRRLLVEKYGAKYSFSDYHDLLKMPNLNGVIVAVPHYLHKPITVECLDARKHVMVEKPIALNLNEADQMISKARKARLKLAVVCPLRFDEDIQRGKSAVEDGKLGKLILGEASVKWFREKQYYAKARWRSRWSEAGGGALTNQAIHIIDLLQWFMGPVDYLWGQYDTMIHDIEVEDIAIAALRFKNKALGVIQGGTSFYSALPAKLEIHGSNGTIVYHPYSKYKTKRWIFKGDARVPEERKGEEQGPSARPEIVELANHVKMLRDFAEAILEDRPPYVPFEEGRKTLEIIQGIYNSQQTSSVVKFA